MATQTITFTSTFSRDLMLWIDQFAKQQGTTKRQILEEAIKKYKTEMRREELAQSFQKAAQDSEITEMAEDGLDDLLEQISKY